MRLALLPVVVAAIVVPIALSDSPGDSLCFTGTQAPATHPRSQARHHYEYVFPNGAMCVFDADRGHRLVQAARLPGADAIRGVAASPRTRTLYVSYGGDGGPNGSGSLLAYDLLGDRISWRQSYSTGIDSLAISPNGKLIYMPTGELASGGTWQVIDAATGRVTGSIDGGAGPHNTIVSLDGKHVYLGGRNHDYLEVASTKSNRIVRRIGPLRGGVRPFTINGRQTLAYTTATRFLGFQVSSIRTGKLLYTSTFRGFTWSPDAFEPTAPSHGISLSPNERQVWVIDAPNSYVHVFGVRGVPKSAPRRVANLKLSHALTGAEARCYYDCARDGWLQHSRNGRFVYVGDSGDVFDTRTRRAVAYLPALRETRNFLEIDWAHGVPVATTTRSGLGYVTR